jgi:Tfp pilus assembly protein PilN
MRPVNLIPEEQRRRAGGGAGRTGPLPFILVGALGALLIGVALLVLAGNQISESKAEIAELQARKTAATERADRLEPYIQFQELEQQRTSTVASLAESRFDWVRTMRQLSLVIPPNVWLTKLNAAASSESGGIAGPSLSIEGCARGQDAVAGFVASLKQIDGVTRVGLSESALATEAGGSSGSGGEGCEGANFKLVVAFDAAPPALTASSEAEAEEAEPEGEKGEEEKAEAEPAKAGE